jgi:DNA-binding NtrC family response regulator
MKEHFDALLEHFMRTGFFLVDAVELLEKNMIARTLERAGGNRCEASKTLGIHRNTLGKKMKQYKIELKKPMRKPVARAAWRTKLAVSAGK